MATKTNPTLSDPSFFNSWTLKGLFRRKNQQRDQEEAERIKEEQKRLIEEGTDFDRLLQQPGWARILEHVSNKVNTEITLATEDPMNVENQATHITRWCAMREVLDDMIDHVEGTRRSRDELIELQKEIENEYRTSNPAGN